MEPAKLIFTHCFAVKMEVRQSLTLSPTEKSLIRHSLLPTMNEKGLEATIFIEKPNESKYAFVESNSVYVTTCDENKAFDEFIYSSETAVILTIPMYISILTFFKNVWPDIQKNCESNFAKIRSELVPFQVTPYIHFTLSAVCNYEANIEDVSLLFEKRTEDKELPNLFRLHRNGRSIWLNAENMRSLAEVSLQHLVNTLYKAGYVDSDSQSDHA